MHSWLKRISVVGIPLTLLVVVAPIAQASTQALGSWSITIAPKSVTTADGNVIIKFSLSEIISGTFTGTRVGEGVLVEHPDGSFEARDSGTYTGMVAGKAGSATVAAQATGTFSSVTGHVAVTDGSGGLSGIQAQINIVGSATGPASFAGTYAGVIH